MTQAIHPLLDLRDQMRRCVFRQCHRIAVSTGVCLIDSTNAKPKLVIPCVHLDLTPRIGRVASLLFDGWKLLVKLDVRAHGFPLKNPHSATEPI